MKCLPAQQRCTTDRFHSSGFTLVELLVTITIIAALAALSTIGVTRMRFAAAKANTVNQLRQVGVGVLTWAAEKNSNDPFYVANGTGDHSDESAPGPDPVLAPGNPAAALFNTDEPEQGYTTDHRLFFSPFLKLKVPTRKEFKPKEATTGKPWGTYVWYYPYTTTPTAKQDAASGQDPGQLRIHPRLDKKLMMKTDYSRDKVVWKEFQMGLLVDGTVRELSPDETPTRPPG